MTDVPEEFDECIEQAHVLLANMESDRDATLANAYVNRALMLRPLDGWAWLLKTHTIASMEDHPAALACAEMAVNLLPTSAEAHYVRSTVLADLGRYDEALETIELAFARVLPEEDEWVLEDLYFEKARALDALRRCEEAIAVFQQGLAHFPDSELLRAGLEPLSRERLRSRLRVIDGAR